MKKEHKNSISDTWGAENPVSEPSETPVTPPEEPSETPVTPPEEPSETPETPPDEQQAEQKNEGKKKMTFNERAKYTTSMNDPDLAVGPYVPPEEGEEIIKCPNCGAEMPATIDTCVNCGHYLKADKQGYQPMKKSTIKKARWIIGIICVLLAALYFFVLRK